MNPQKAPQRNSGRPESPSRPLTTEWIGNHRNSGNPESSSRATERLSNHGNSGNPEFSSPAIERLSKHINNGCPESSSRATESYSNHGNSGNPEFSSPAVERLSKHINSGNPESSSRPLTTKNLSNNRKGKCPESSSRPLTTERLSNNRKGKCPESSSRPLTTESLSNNTKGKFPESSSRPLTTERCPKSSLRLLATSIKFQPSVYKGTTGQYFAEPSGDRMDYYWVTVWFHKDIDHRGISDSTIMMRVMCAIEDGDFTIEDRAMHGIGKKCLSIPIKRDPDTPMPKSHTPDPTHPDLLLARNLAEYWNDQIVARKVTLDQRMIFVDKRRKMVRLEEMLDVGEVLMDPWNIL
ncbi:hypothetical protein N7527_008938 [Penicillium freii]|nr:hypothetical protein N7527_008938 [Penicillium freii]